jgi:hypothetical protein
MTSRSIATDPASATRPGRARDDPRPTIVAGPGADVWHLLGGRCVRCGHPNPTDAPRCPRCGGATAPAAFGPHGVVWSTTTIRVDSDEPRAPYTLAYVDLDDGPRLLAVVAAGPVRVGARVRLTRASDRGDPQVEEVG